MSLTMQGSGIANLDKSSVEVRLDDYGNYVLMVGSTDMGTGSDTILAQMAAEILMTDMDKITVIASDTDMVPYDPGSYASSTTYVTGMAVVKAAEDLRDKIIKSASKQLEINIEDLEFDGEKVFSVEHGKELSVFDISVNTTIGTKWEQLIGFSSYGSSVSPPPFMAGFAETEVDKETGKVELINYVAIADCGTVINENLAKIQVEGGIVQGIGMAMFEEVRHTDNGYMDTNTFMQYKIPSRVDVGNIKVEFIETYEPTGPFGAKSIGEVVINTPLAAIQDSVFNAVGIRVNNLPITPEKVFMELNK